MKCGKCGKEMSFENTTGRGHGIGLCEECEWKSPADLPEAGASAERISSVIRSARELVNFGDWILASKIQLCDKRCLMQNIETDFGKVTSNQCDRESCPELVFKLLLDNVRAHF